MRCRVGSCRGFGNRLALGPGVQYPARVERDIAHANTDPVVQAYKAGVDRSLIRQNLRRSIEERLEALIKLQEFAEELRRAGRRTRLP